MKKYIVIVAGLSVWSMCMAASMVPSRAPEKARSGSVIKVISSQVPTYCDFNQQIMTIGYDRNDNIVMACVKKD